MSDYILLSFHREISTDRRKGKKRKEKTPYKYFSFPLFYSFKDTLQRGDEGAAGSTRRFQDSGKGPGVYEGQRRASHVLADRRGRGPQGGEEQGTGESKERSREEESFDTAKLPQEQVVGTVDVHEVFERVAQEIALRQLGPTESEMLAREQPIGIDNRQ